MEYTEAYVQAKMLGEETSTERTTDQTEIGIYWGYDVARGLGDPPRLYNQIAQVIAQQEHNTVAENARMFALINIGMADAGIQSWGVKYRDDFWRPIVAIRQGDVDGNANTVGDPTWSPLGAPRSNPLPTEDVNFTPPFPAYVSGHATFGGAAFKTMTNFFQTDDIRFNIPFNFISDEFNGLTTDIHELMPDLVLDHVREMRPRHYDSFSQAAAENAASRIFLGIHWRFDAVEGVSAGNRIADYNFDHVLRPRSNRGPTHVASTNFANQIDAYLNNTYTTSAEAVAADMIEVIVAPGTFNLQMLNTASPLVHQVMTEMMNHSQQFKSLVQTIDRLAQHDRPAFHSTLYKMEAKLRDKVFAERDLIENLAQGLM